MKRLGTIISVAIFAAVGAASGMLLTECQQRLSVHVPYAVLLLGFAAVFYIGIMLHTVIHEAGHLVGGLLTGYKFVSFRVGSVIWTKKGNKLSCGRLKIAGTGGQCLMAPPRLVEGKMPVALYNLGGILMGLIASGVFAALCLAFENVPLLWTGFAIIAIVGVALALINAIPLKGGYNDGSNLLYLRKNPDAVYALWLQLAVNAYISMGTRLKDMPAVWFEKRDNEDLGNNIMSAVAVLRVNRFMDGMKLEEARAEAERILKDGSVITMYKHLLRLELIYIGLVKGDTESVDRLYTTELKKFMRAMKAFPSVPRTEYVYALLYEKNPQHMAEKKAAFEKAAARYPYQHEMESERELIAYAEKIAYN